MLFATPLGRLADRVGRGVVFLGGYGALLSVYLILLTPSLSGFAVMTALLLLGLYYAATDGVLAALGSSHLPEELRGSGLAILGTATSAARLVASLLFGALWTAAGVGGALGCFAIGLVLATALSGWGLRRGHA
jgi:MFS family permease